MRDDVFFRTFLAALVAKGRKNIRMKPSHLHYAFRAALQKADIREFCAIDIQWDSLYGISAWLNKQLAKASHDLVLGNRRGAPVHYEILYSPFKAQRLLAESGQQKKFLALADRFLEIAASTA